ncbi:MAG: DUF547 domain-containing protein [Desulfobacterales bacterium]|jgi:hypothetical protein
MKTKTTIAIAAILIIMATLVTAAGFEQSRFDQVLKTYVNAKGLVDYNGIAGDAQFKAYMKSLETADPNAMSRDGQLAFWINAYNAVTIDKVIEWKPQKSVRETLIPGVWTSTKFFTTRDHIVAGKRLSQDDIENDILRKQFKEPRIHFAIVCASSSCPPLPRFAYTAENVQAKLEEETRKYINSDRGTRIDAADNTLYLSKLFDWYKGDFEFKSGSVLNFIKPYLNEKTLKFLERDPQIAYLDYDWSLNALKPIK